MNRKEIKLCAKQSLKGHIATAILIMLIMQFMTIGIGTITIFAAFLTIPLIYGPLKVGMSFFYLKITNGEEGNVGDVFFGFKSMVQSFLCVFLRSLYVMLWSLLLVVPGIMKYYSYAMAPYIMAENLGISANEAITRSKNMMKGHRMELFVFKLSFFGWYLLGSATLGLAMFYVIPYTEAATAVFYRRLTLQKTETAVRPEPGEGELSLPSGSAQTTVLNQTPDTGAGIFTGTGGSLAGQAYFLADGEVYNIGRDSSQCGIAISDNNITVSRVHCSVRYSAADDGFYLTDMSSNGTFVNGEKLSREQMQFVRRGAEVSLGDRVNCFQLN